MSLELGRLGDHSPCILTLNKLSYLIISYWIVAYYLIILLCLLIISASYLTIRKRLNRRVPILDTVHNRQNGSEQNTKLSRTLFIMIAASLVCWIPAIVVYCMYFLCTECLPITLVYLTTTFRLANSLINSIIYSCRIPVYRQTLTRIKICNKSQHYSINYKKLKFIVANYMVWNMIQK